jgi:hypothetical protein
MIELGWQTFHDWWPWMILVIVLCLAVHAFIRMTATSSEKMIAVLAKLGAEQAAPKSNDWLPSERPTDSTSLAEAKRIILDWMRPHKITVEGHAEELFHRLATERLEAAYTRFYDLLFGSQFRFLQALNEMPQGATREEAHAFLTRFLTNLKVEKPHEFDVWLDFLFRAGAIEAEDNKLNITQYGRDFLAWVLLMRKPAKNHE